ncbi:MAG: gliding motility-associated-like protein [Saprospiraceae bacterium]|jgi:gliding motility-associated-like protein
MVIGTNVNWILLDGSGVSIQTAGPSSSTSFTFNVPVGNYTLQAVPQNLSGSCNTIYEISIIVNALPPLPTAVNGIDLICPGTAYTYNADGLPVHEFHWFINNGGVMTEDFGDQLNVIWGASPPYELQLSQIAVSGLQCESQTIVFSATAISGFILSGTEQICREQSGLYNADAFENIDYAWTVTPEDAGTIIDGEGTANVEIFWHSAGNHTITLDVCGMTETLAVTIFDLPEPTAVFPALLCPFEEGFVSTTVLYDAYEWRDEFGGVVSIDPNPGLIPGYYEVVVTDANGCTGNDIFKIEGLPQPNVSISSPDILGLCLPSTITLYAIEITGGYDYQWYQDGVATGTNASTLDISDPGGYYTIVTDQNGCTAQSNTLNFIDCATAGGVCVGGVCVGGDGGGGGNPGPGCTPAGVVDFTFNTTGECNVIEFQNTSINYLPGSENWSFQDFDSGAANSSSVMNPAHLFSKPGFFRVRLSVTLLDAAGMPCGTWWTVKPVMVPAAADFLTDQGCVGSPVQFNDHSAFLPAEITEITGWSWDFGDPASGAANTSTDQNPTHTYADEVFYTVTLTITTTEGCTSTVQKQVSVNQAPEITFLPPVINCQNTSLEFVLDYPAGNNIVDVIWDFGDAASGDANSSIQETTYHAYETPGDYDVVATATNIYDCTATYTTVVTVEPNTLMGTIDPPAPSPICEGDDMDLTASPGGSFWNWSTGENSETINVSAEGVYSVTVTNEDGCTYSPAPVLVEIIPAPIGTIQAIEYNEYEQPTGYFDSGYTVCEGEDVYLFTQTSADYTFNWSTGDPTQEISFTDDKGNLLPAGSHDFSVTITNTTTGCSSVAGPFEVVINPTPNNVTISSTPGGPLCDGASATLNVDNPDANLTYVWNTGEQGTSILAFAAGEYFVRAINSFGCEGESNRISIENAPNINSVPSGCHFSCLPDTICLPNIPNIAAYQWFMDGVAIPAPEGTVADLIINQNGSYTVELIDVFGCTATSDPVVMTLVPGFGNILGEVWFDVNESGSIDAGDTLVSNMELILIDNGMFLDTAVTNGSGFYGFANQVSSNNYTLLFNTNNLPPTWNVYQASQSASLNGCDDEIIVDFLLFDNCVSPPTALTVETCAGEQVEYDGILLNGGDVQDFTLQNQYQCDSIVTVTVDELPTYADNVNLKACQGLMIEYDGVMLNPGDMQDFDYQTFTGCDSTITVTVEEVVPSFSQVDLEVCKDETVSFMNLDFAAGTSQDFVFADQYGCDSTITLVVDAYPELTFDLTAEKICFNAIDGAIEVIDIQGGATGLEYSIDGLNYQATVLFENLQAGVYDVYVRDDNGCIYENAIEMPTIPALNISVETGIIDCADDGVELKPIVTNANPAEVTWEWSDGSTEPTLFAKEAGVYSYAVTNNCQTETGQVEVKWAQDGRTQFFFMPNVFSPNNDGANDDFSAYLEQNVEVQKYTMKIFDRWGTMMFETDNHLNKWDGNFGGKLAGTGVYVVYVDAIFIACGREIREQLEGDVTLLR